MELAACDCSQMSHEGTSDLSAPLGPSKPQQEGKSGESGSVVAVSAQLRRESHQTALPQTKRPWVVWVTALCTFAAFSLIQLHAELAANTNWIGPPGGVATQKQVYWGSFWYHLTGDLARFLGLSLACFLLVIRGRRRTYALPALSYVLAPLLLGWRDTDCEFTGRTLQAIGSGWVRTFGCMSATASGVFLALLELGLVLLPVVLFAVRRRKAHAVALDESVDSPRLFDIAGIAFAVFAVWVLKWGWETSGLIPGPFHGVLIVALPLAVFGFAVGSLRPRWASALFGVTVLLAAEQLQLTVPRQNWGNVVQSLQQTWPFLAIPVVAAAWCPIARVLNWLGNKSKEALILFNILNIADALLTRYAVKTEGAVETNPVVRAVGLPLKVAAAGMLSIVLYRARPGALRWLVLALSGVLVWHLAGFWASPR